MTGDGSNGVPALKKAYIGFAIGIAGTNVAKMLLESFFLMTTSSLLSLPLNGVKTFSTVLEISYSSNSASTLRPCLWAGVGGTVLRKSPFNVIQMFWVNFIMDTLASLTLDTEPPSDELLKRKPY